MSGTYQVRPYEVAIFGLALAVTCASAFGGATKYVAQCNYIDQSLTQSDGKSVNAGATSDYKLCIQRRTRKGGLDATFNSIGERIFLEEAEVHSVERLPSGNYVVKGFFPVKSILFSWEVSSAGSEVGWAYYPVDCADPAYSSLSGCVNAANTSAGSGDCSDPAFALANPDLCPAPEPSPSPSPEPYCSYYDPSTGQCLY